MTQLAKKTSLRRRSPRGVRIPSPPTASRCVDDYAWLKDAKLAGGAARSVDPRCRHPQPISRRRTAIPRACSATPPPCRRQLVAEMRGRIKEDDSSVPSPDGPFAYLRKFREGGQHELFGRTPRDGGEVQIVLDGDALAATSRLFQVRRRAAFAGPPACRRGAPTLRARNISRSGCATGRPAKICDDSSRRPMAAWSGARTATFFFYVKLDDNHRPMQVWRHRLGTKQADDVLVYEEKDSGWFTHLHESASGRFCMIAGGDHDTSEQRLIDLADPEARRRAWSRRARKACTIRSTTAATSCSFSPTPTARSTSRSPPRRSPRRSARTGAS